MGVCSSGHRPNQSIWDRKQRSSKVYNDIDPQRTTRLCAHTLIVQHVRRLALYHLRSASRPRDDGDMSTYHDVLLLRPRNPTIIAIPPLIPTLHKRRIMPRTQTPKMIRHSIQIIFERRNLRPRITAILHRQSIRPRRSERGLRLGVREIGREIESTQREIDQFVYFVGEVRFGAEAFEVDKENGG